MCLKNRAFHSAVAVRKLPIIYRLPYYQYTNRQLSSNIIYQPKPKILLKIRPFYDNLCSIMSIYNT